eukprot:TRINITY_DN13279_c0_g1_i1.p1 TRINITY_DN13279_c0_g1~~TRINITY_DN13279_c0_g1_i1.p1  ORF type:complete len:193 (+),score=19.54 TRINITY_DN13279_c0_g1_i1:84-662(+)
MTQIPAEVESFLWSERIVANLLVIAGITSLLVVRSLLSGKPDVSAKLNTKKNKIELKEKAPKVLPQRQAIGVTLVAGVLQIAAGLFCIYLARQHVLHVRSSASPSLSADFYLQEMDRMDSVVNKYTLVTGIENIVFLLGVLMVVLRMRIPYPYVWLGGAMAGEAGLMYIIDSIGHYYSKAYLDFLLSQLHKA